MSLRGFWGAFILLVAVATIGAPGPSLCAQVKPSDPNYTSAHGPPVHGKSKNVYEDTEIKVVIPADWRIVPHDEIVKNGRAGASLGNSVSQAKGKLLLENSGYTLGIAYNTSQASGIIGGRFIEIFNIPWPNVDDAWTCSLYLESYAQPASRVLIFTNLTVDSGNAKVRENCGIRKDFGRWIEKNGSRTFDGERRWFGGFFTTARGGYFFDSSGDGCGEKAYTLTFQASMPDRLPEVGEPGLNKMIQGAIDIVDSIHYKRCPPATD